MDEIRKKLEARTNELRRLVDKGEKDFDHGRLDAFYELTCKRCGLAELEEYTMSKYQNQATPTERLKGRKAGYREALGIIFGEAA